MIKVTIWEACGARCCLWPVVSQHIENNAQAGEAITSQHQQPQDTESGWKWVEQRRSWVRKIYQVCWWRRREIRRGDSDKEHRGKKKYGKRLEAGRKEQKHKKRKTEALTSCTSWSDCNFCCFGVWSFVFSSVFSRKLLDELALTSSLMLQREGTRSGIIINRRAWREHVKRWMWSLRGFRECVPSFLPPHDLSTLKCLHYELCEVYMSLVYGDVCMCTVIFARQHRIYT